jgi:UDP-N-acetylmuramate: L-alanyl-gamma-D-glutamyl-meso-diaminopimelate ligase
MNFTVLQEGRAWGEFFLPMLGTHNVWNGLAALAALWEVGGDPGDLRKALAGFQGVHKRQEVVGEFQGVLIVQDFAHHPTAVAVTLQAVRQGYPGRRLLAVFEPRTNTSRRRVFQEPYAAAFKDADLVLVREPPDLWKVEPEEQFSSRQLASDLGRQGHTALYFPDTDQLLKGLLDVLQPGDLVLIMSNGDFDHLAPRLAAALG